MWMMMDTNNEHGREYKLPVDPVIGRKLRPLMPRQISSSSNNPYSTLLSTPSACCCIRNPNILSWNHSTSDECCGVKREAAAPLVSTRWNPTVEQLQALEEMYRRGIRTPSAEQIQQIAAKLGRFGKIEGKNVFYWFQNHKARERQKKRRQLELLAVAGKKMHHAHAIHTKHQTPGLSRRCFEIEHHKKVPIPSNCSTASEDSASMHGAVIAAEAVCGKDECNHKELQHKVGSATAENESSCCQLHLDLSSCLPLNNAITKGQENINTLPTSINPITMLAPNITDDNLNRREKKHEVKEDQTLELFPSPRPRGGGEIHHHTFTIGTKVAPSQFIEFLPIKN